MTVQQETAYDDCGEGPPWALEFFRRLCLRHEIGRVRGGGEALRARWQQARADDDQLVAVLLRRADDLGSEERAVLPAFERRDDEDPGERLARDHGWHDDHRVVAMRALATSRGISLERTLRAAMRGDLRSIVELPPVERRAETATDDEERSDR
ncbi:MAG: hypothetical protein H0U61_14970 [Nocardioidaceae bacterium]|nr:hypothetical protein [Nocardioidaceae bacterium]